MHVRPAVFADVDSEGRTIGGRALALHWILGALRARGGRVGGHIAFAHAAPASIILHHTRVTVYVTGATNCTQYS